MKETTLLFKVAAVSFHTLQCLNYENDRQKNVELLVKKDVVLGTGAKASTDDVHLSSDVLSIDLSRALCRRVQTCEDGAEKEREKKNSEH